MHELGAGLDWLAIAIGGLGIIVVAGWMAERRYGPLWPGRGGHARRRGTAATGDLRSAWGALGWLGVLALTGIQDLDSSPLLGWIAAGIGCCVVAWQLDKWFRIRARLDARVRARARRLRQGEPGEP
jgi:hypothetical protein